jgi:zinc D-Ala-D-Ala carboxypeptidase
MSKISKNITYKEAIHSNTAKRLGIENEPSHEQIANMMTIAKMIFQPLRSYVGGPIKITSFFRSPKLNKAIGGSKTSQHCKGQAKCRNVYVYKRKFRF